MSDVIAFPPDSPALGLILYLVAFAGIALVSYLLGTIPTAYLAVRLRRGQDIRQMGDGNAGAANAARAAGARLGIAVGVIDVGKGAAAVLLAWWLLDSTAAQMMAGVAAIAGHNWPVYLQGRGGRGAATGIGVLLAMLPMLGLALAVSALAVLYLTRSSTRAIAAFFIPLPFLAWPVGYPYPLALYSLAIPIMVGLSHYLSVKRSPIPRSDQSGQQPLPQSVDL